MSTSFSSIQITQTAVTHPSYGWPGLLRLRDEPEGPSGADVDADVSRLLTCGLEVTGGVALGARFVPDAGEPRVVTAGLSAQVVTRLSAETEGGARAGEFRLRPLDDAALALGLLTHATVALENGGCLSLFDTVAHDARDQLVMPLRAVAEHLSVLVANAAALAACRATIVQLREAMLSRSIIEQAKGVLMARERIDAETAWEYLVKISQRSHRKLREICTDIVQKAGTGTLG